MVGGWRGDGIGRRLPPKIFEEIRSMTIELRADFGARPYGCSGLRDGAVSAIKRYGFGAARLDPLLVA